MSKASWHQDDWCPLQVYRMEWIEVAGMYVHNMGRQEEKEVENRLSVIS